MAAKKTTIAAEIETILFTRKFRQRLRSHSKAWNAEWRRLEKLAMQDISDDRAGERLDRLTVDYKEVTFALKTLLDVAKKMDRMNSR